MRLSKGLLLANSLAILCICVSSTLTMAKPKSDDREKKESPSSGPLSRAEAMTLLIDDLKAPLTRGAVRKIAVLDLTDLDGNCSALGRFLAEELTTGLSRGGDIEVVERNRLRQILTDLNEFSAPEPETYKTLQQSLGVDAVVVGTLTQLGDITRINLRVIATDVGRVVTAGAQEFAMDGPLLQLIKTPCKGATVAAPTAATATTSSSTASPEQTAASETYVAGLLGRYYNWDDRANAWSEEPVFQRVDGALSFKCKWWGRVTPAPRLNWGAWSANWKGQIYAPVTGMYSFHISSEGRLCEIRIDGKMLVNQTGEHTVDLRLDVGWHDFLAHYIAGESNKTTNMDNWFVLTWSKPGEGQFDRIPNENFRHLKK